jgi:hypothetical protein
MRSGGVPQGDRKIPAERMIMDVTVVTSDAATVQATEIAEALGDAGFFVNTVTVKDREGVLFDEFWEVANADA